MGKMKDSTIPKWDQYSHDPMCQISVRPCCPWMGVCDCQCECDWIARVREDERSKTLKAASEALDVLDRWGEDTYKHIVIDYDEAVAAIESLGDGDD